MAGGPAAASVGLLHPGMRCSWRGKDLGVGRWDSAGDFHWELMSRPGKAWLR